jgi:hypothetical protein
VCVSIRQYQDASTRHNDKPPIRNRRIDQKYTWIHRSETIRHRLPKRHTNTQVGNDPASTAKNTHEYTGQKRSGIDCQKYTCIHISETIRQSIAKNTHEYTDQKRSGNRLPKRHTNTQVRNDPASTAKKTHECTGRKRSGIDSQKYTRIHRSETIRHRLTKRHTNTQIRSDPAIDCQKYTRIHRSETIRQSTAKKTHVSIHISETIRQSTAKKTHEHTGQKRSGIDSQKDTRTHRSETIRHR